ncbi:hypothetical protein QE152_g22662 [Popillia japonica]|uniref:Gag protein n=1 Tax=Popillia japonica TaxID=7064 RepID=A0AAW1KKD2_POPJA
MLRFYRISKGSDLQSDIEGLENVCYQDKERMRFEENYFQILSQLHERIDSLTSQQLVENAQSHDQPKHEPGQCRRLKTAPATCVNCNGDHPANYKRCVRYPKPGRVRSDQEKSSKRDQTHSYSQAVTSNLPKTALQQHLGKSPAKTPKSRQNRPQTTTEKKRQPRSERASRRQPNPTVGRSPGPLCVYRENHQAINSIIPSKSIPKHHEYARR